MTRLVFCVPPRAVHELLHRAATQQWRRQRECINMSGLGTQGGRGARLSGAGTHDAPAQKRGLSRQSPWPRTPALPSWLLQHQATVVRSNNIPTNLSMEHRPTAVPLTAQCSALTESPAGAASRLVFHDVVGHRMRPVNGRRHQVCTSPLTTISMHKQHSARSTGFKVNALQTRLTMSIPSMATLRDGTRIWSLYA